MGAPLVSHYRDLEVRWSPGATGGITALELPAARVELTTVLAGLVLACADPPGRQA